MLKTELVAFLSTRNCVFWLVESRVQHSQVEMTLFCSWLVFVHVCSLDAQNADKIPYKQWFYLWLTSLSLIGSRGLRFIISDSAVSYANEMAGTYLYWKYAYTDDKHIQQLHFCISNLCEFQPILFFFLSKFDFISFFLHVYVVLGLKVRGWKKCALLCHFAEE